MRLPIHPHLLALRSAATIVLSLLVGQAGWAAAFLGQSHRFFRLHMIFGFVTLAATLVSVLVYVVLRNSAGRTLVIMMIGVAAMVVTQIVLGEAKVKAVHIFVGVLTAMAGTALTSWTYRHRLPDAVTAPR